MIADEVGSLTRKRGKRWTMFDLIPMHVEHHVMPQTLHDDRSVGDNMSDG